MVKFDGSFSVLSLTHADCGSLSIDHTYADDWMIGYKMPGVRKYSIILTIGVKKSMRGIANEKGKIFQIRYVLKSLIESKKDLWFNVGYLNTKRIVHIFPYYSFRINKILFKKVKINIISRPSYIFTVVPEPK